MSYNIAVSKLQSKIALVWNSNFQKMSKTRTQVIRKFPWEKITLILILTIVLLFGFVRSENILVLCPLSSKSHKNVIEPLISSLAKRGHNLTVVSAYKPTNQRPNIREIVPIDGFDYLPNFNPFKERQFGYLSLYLKGFQHFYNACEQIHRDEEFIELKNQSFDLVIIDALLNGCFQGLIYILSVPFISFSSLTAPNFVTETVGVKMPPSFVPMLVTSYGDQMSFLQRVHNFLLHLGLCKVRWDWAKNYEQIYRKHFGESIPGMKELEENVSVIFTNTGFLEYPRPTSNHLVDIGGIHCRDGRELPQHIRAFLEGDPNSFILFSLGSVVKSRDMPKEMFQIFLNVFSRLNLTVIWKWDVELLLEEIILPENVKLAKWLPQQDLLAHPNIKLFITHGGLLSSQEAIYHGVPMVGIPMFADQDRNVKIAERAGISVFLEILQLDENRLENLISKILTDSRYKERALELSDRVRDQLESPLQRAVYWTEYVLRNKDYLPLNRVAAPTDFKYLDLMFATVISLVTTLVFFCFIYKFCRGTAMRLHI